MRLRQNKRGQVLHYVYLVLIQVVLASTVALAFSGFLYEIKQSTYPQKLYLTRDISSILSGLVGLPENLDYVYNRRGITENYSIKIEDSIVSVEEYGVKTKRAMRYKYADSAFMNVDASAVVGETPLILFKDGAQFGIQTKKPLGYLNQHFCNPVQTTTTSLTLDPGHGSPYDLGFTYSGIVEKDIVREIAKVTSQGLPRGFNVEVTRTLQGPEDEDIISVEDRIKSVPKNSALISIHLGNREEEKNYIRAYFNADSKKKQESVYFACNILNGFVQKIEAVNSTALIPVDLAFIDKDDPLQILTGSDVAVYLEIGTVKNVFVGETVQLGESIQEGLRGYIT